MVAILRCSTAHCVLAIALVTLTIESAYGQTIDFTWTSEGTFSGSFFSATADDTFTSSAPFNLTQSHVQLTGQPVSATDWRLLGSFEITAANGDKLLGNYDTTGQRNGFFFTGPFRFTGGTGQFFGATGQGTIDNIITMYEPLPAPNVAGTVETEWRGVITLVPAAMPGDYNHDGSVDAADYVVWRKTLGQTEAGLAADGDGSGAVDQADYDLWRENFGAIVTNSTHAAESAAAGWESAVRRGGLPYMSAVPELSSILFAVELIVMLAVTPKRVRAR
jgi:hypothetical protein